MKPIITICAVAALVAYCTVETLERTTSQAEQARHCQMAQLYKDTSGAYGEPGDLGQCDGYGNTAAGAKE